MNKMKLLIFYQLLWCTMDCLLCMFTFFEIHCELMNLRWITNVPSLKSYFYTLKLVNELGNGKIDTLRLKSRSNKPEPKKLINKEIAEKQ